MVHFLDSDFKDLQGLCGHLPLPPSPQVIVVFVTHNAAGVHAGVCGLCRCLERADARDPRGCLWRVLPLEAVFMSVVHAATGGHVAVRGLCMLLSHVDVRGLCCHHGDSRGHLEITDPCCPSLVKDKEAFLALELIN